jgi:hypothetical protein
MSAWNALLRCYPGWSLADVKELSHRERLIWFELATK